MPHDLGDPLLSTAILWWNAHVVPLTERWWNGFAYYPAAGFLAYSDHRLGESLIATPLQWIGASPLTAYNVTLLATFPLCAIAAHWLAFTLTARHDAATLCGLAYGFNPYRMSHIEHLELLAAFGMPVALVALHRYATTRERKWLLLLAGSLFLQGLCTSYYLLFFSVFIALWAVWFLRWRDRPVAAPIAGAAAAAALLLVPIIAGYVRIHRQYGFARPYGDIVTLSADVTSLATTSALSLLWGWTSAWNGPERQLFPGLTIVALAIAGAVIGWRAHPAVRDRLDRRSLWLVPPSLLFLTIAFAAWMWEPWRIDVAGIRISSNSPFKPMSLAIFALAAVFVMRSRVRAAYARRSVFAFYLIAAALMFICALGPKPAFRHEQILYEPPYAWLMRLPVFGSVRAPARFGMPAILALSVAAALAFHRFRLASETRRLAAPLLAAAIVADGWIHDLPLLPPPGPWPAPRAAGFASVMEVPLGDLWDDLAATYRATQHRHSIVNGSSGFEAIHYPTLALAMKERDPSALDPIFAKGPTLVVVHKPLDRSGSWQQYLLSIPGVSRIGDDEGHFYFGAVPQAPAPPLCAGELVPPAAAHDGRGAVDVRALTDGDPFTYWITAAPATVGEFLVLDLGRAGYPCAIAMGMGVSRVNYPRKVSVDVSSNGADWTTVATERTAGLMVKALLDTPRGPSIALGMEPQPARFVRLRLEEAAERDPWLIAEISVTSAPRQE